MRIQKGAVMAGFLLGLAALAGCGGTDDAPTNEAPPGPPEPMRVLTFNVLCSFCGGGEYDSWEDRLAYFQDIFQRHDPDLMGLQELAFGSEVDTILGLVDGYAALYYRDPETVFTYPDATILYRVSRFDALESGFFWLSPTPDVASSIGFASQQVPRLVTWAKLRDKNSRRPFYFASTHVDNNSPSQEKSAPLILERTEPWADQAPVILVGDFNSNPTTEAYGALTSGAASEFHYLNAQGLAAAWSVDTNLAEEPAYDLDMRIDHIFLGASTANPVDWSVTDWKVDIHTYGPNNLYASDHFPMVSNVLAGVAP